MKVISTPRRLKLLVCLGLLLFSLGACSQEPKKEPHMVIEAVGNVDWNKFHSIHSSPHHVSLSNKPNSVDVIIRVYLITENRRREINTLFVTSLRVKELYFAIDTPAESYAVERFGDFGVPMLYSAESFSLESPDGNDKTKMEVGEYYYMAIMQSKRIDAHDNGETDEIPFFQMMGQLKNKDDEKEAHQTGKDKDQDQNDRKEVDETGKDQDQGKEKESELPPLEFKDIFNARLIDVGGNDPEPSTWKLKELLDTETVDKGDYRIVATISWKKASRRLRAKMREEEQPD